MLEWLAGPLRLLLAATGRKSGWVSGNAVQEWLSRQEVQQKYRSIGLNRFVQLRVVLHNVVFYMLDFKACGSKLGISSIEYCTVYYILQWPTNGIPWGYFLDPYPSCLILHQETMAQWELTGIAGGLPGSFETWPGSFENSFSWDAKSWQVFIIPYHP